MSDAAPRNGWRTVRFDEIATIVNDRVDDPLEANVDYYVGLEHLDSESLAIRRWGSPTDVEATKLRFRAGDIIFGRRRVYQRKLGVARFDGICSAHAMVLRAKPDVVLPEFLPFFMQSDLFMERAKEISVGSLSPTINWKTLAKEAFDLPPLQDQRRIAAALEAVDATAERYREARQALMMLTDNWLQMRLGAVGTGRPLDTLLMKTEYGCSAYSSTEPVGTPILRIPNVLRDELDLTDLKWVKLSPGDTAKYLLRPGDILMVRTNGNPSYVGRCLVVPQLEVPTLFASYLIRLVVDPLIARPEYLANALNSPAIRHSMRAAIRSSAGNFNINTKGIRGVSVPIPTLPEQDAILSELSALKATYKRVIDRAKELVAVRRVICEGLES